MTTTPIHSLGEATNILLHLSYDKNLVTDIFLRALEQIG